MAGSLSPDEASALATTAACWDIECYVREVGDPDGTGWVPLSTVLHAIDRVRDHAREHLPAVEE